MKLSFVDGSHGIADRNETAVKHESAVKHEIAPDQSVEDDGRS
jgi:hypothetical protein